MSVICSHFVQNSWCKRDICSNCLKTSGEHCGKLDTKLALKHRGSGFAELIKDRRSSSNLILKSTALLRDLQKNSYGLEPSELTPSSQRQGMVHLSLANSKMADTCQTDSGLMSSRLVQMAANSGDSSTSAPPGSKAPPASYNINSAINKNLVAHGSRDHGGGILILEGQRRKRVKNISFNDKPDVIGIGGESVEVNFELNECPAEDEPISALTSEERSLLNLTKRNTDFNSINSNLLGTTRTLVDWVDEQDLTTERSALTGRHKKFTPVVSIAPFGGSRGSAGVKVNLVAPMKNGEVITEKRSRKEMVEKHATHGRSSATLVEKITRLDDLIDDKKKITKPADISSESSEKTDRRKAGEPVSITEVTSVHSNANGKESKSPVVETRLSFQIGGSSPDDKKCLEKTILTKDSNSAVTASETSYVKAAKSLSPKLSSKPISSGNSEPSKLKGSSPTMPNTERTGSNCSVTSPKPAPKSPEQSTAKTLYVKAKAPVRSNGRLGASSAVQSRKSKDSPPPSPTGPTATLNDLDTAPQSLPVEAKPVAAAEPASLPFSPISTKHSSRASFLYAMTSQQENDAAQPGSLPGLNSDQVADDKTKTSVDSLSQIPSESVSSSGVREELKKAASQPAGGSAQKLSVLREKPKIAAKPAALQRLSRTISSGEYDGERDAEVSPPVGRPEVKTLNAPTTQLSEGKKESDVVAAGTVCVEVKSEILDPSARLTKLVEDVSKKSSELSQNNHLTISLPNRTSDDSQKLTRAEKIMKRERDLEKLREDLGRRQVTENDEVTKKSLSSDPVKKDPAPLPPHRPLRKSVSTEFDANRLALMDKLTFGTKTESAKERTEKDIKSESQVTNIDAAGKSSGQPIVEVGDHDASKSTAFSSDCGAKSLEQEIVKLISDTFAMSGNISGTLSSPSDLSPSGPVSMTSKDASAFATPTLFERQVSLEAGGEDDDGDDDLPPSASMRASSVSPRTRKRSGVTFDASAQPYNRETAKVSKPRSRSMPRPSCVAVAPAAEGAGHKKLLGIASSGSYRLDSDSAGGERRSRRDDHKRQGKFSIKKLLKFGKDDKKKEKDRPHGDVRAKPLIIHPLDLTPGGKVEVFVRTDEEKRRDEEERERKKALLIAEGTKVYDSPSFSKMYTSANRGQESAESPGTLSSPSHQLGFNSEGRPRPPPPPRRTSSIDLTGAVSAVGSPPVRPPPPNPDLVSRARHDASNRSPPEGAEYANLGVNRAGMTPRKPERAGSVRQERNVSRDVITPSSDDKQQSPDISRPDAPPMSLPVSLNDSKTIEGAKTVGADPSSNPARQPRRQNLRKQTSLTSSVHAELEENYGAVTASNHEALLQVLQQVTGPQSCSAPVALLQSLQHAALAFSHFRLHQQTDTHTARTDTVVGRRVFLGATYRQQPVTLLMCGEPAPPQLLAPLSPLARFRDLVPSNLLPRPHDSNATYSASTQATVWVLPQLKLRPLTELIADWPTVATEEQERAVCLLLLQTVHHLVALQSRGQLFVDESLCELVAVQHDSDAHCHLVTLCGNSSTAANRGRLTGCQAALVVLLRTLGVRDALERVCDGRGVSVPDVPSMNAFELMASLLLQEEPGALERMRGVLESLLWGPPSSCEQLQDQQGLQRWLDLQRANVLSSLIGTQQLWRVRSVDVMLRCRVQFLVETDTDKLKDAADLLNI